VYIYIHIFMYIYAYIFVYVYEAMFTLAELSCNRSGIRECERYVSVCMHIHICMYVCVYDWIFSTSAGLLASASVCVCEREGLYTYTLICVYAYTCIRTYVLSKPSARLQSCYLSDLASVCEYMYAYMCM